MDELDQVLAVLKIGTKRLQIELNAVRCAIAALQGSSKRRSRRLSAAARKDCGSSRARWANWRKQRKST